ncbi:nitroreductase/quinone reductase family protein [Nonomuraea sp. NBC_01738]|uniref:nitroreductase/quinone reductase family protein n=1 Tax=Nonomuraea sp. NBC_01738 TaxID=2976003 RepID=UPI002E0D60BD|nr:nitroreductase/quinone reductase family protein [Nonomuraea sp. NBC_01738]
MPMPKWWGQVNKRVFNPRAIAGGKWPVLIHVGRVSGATYRTPMDAFPVDGGYVFILAYGSRSDWVLNVLAARSARLRADGREVSLTGPRLIDTLPPEVPRPPKLMRITEFLRMDLVAD